MNEPTQELNIEKFDPPVADLQKIVAETKLVTLDDLGDIMQLKVVKEHRAILKDARVKITKTGKMLRADALKFQKDVLVKEKELIAIIEPEETRLTELKDKAEKHVELEKRRSLIPERRERLAEIDPDLKLTDEEIITMDETGFQGFCNKILADKNEKEREKLEKERERVEEEKAKLAEEQKIKDAEEKAVQKERERIDKESKDREEKMKREEQEAKDRIAKEEQESKDRIAKQEQEAKEKLELEEQERKYKIEAERVAKEEAEEGAKQDKKYQEFLTSHGYTEETKSDFMQSQEGEDIRLYKLIGTFKHENS